MMENKDGVIDEDRFSRQLYVFDKTSMLSISTSSVLIVGLDDCGPEICKNILLSGINRLDLHDAKLITEEDRAYNFFISQSDIGKRRDIVFAEKLRQYNKDAKINYIETVKLNEVKNTTVLINNLNFAEALKYNSLTRERNLKMIYLRTRGFFSFVFNDFNNFKTFDKDGNKPIEGVGIITKEDSRIVFESESNRYNLYSGMELKITLNDEQYDIQLKNEKNAYLVKELAIDNGVYNITYREIKQAEIFTHRSLEDNIRKPELLNCDGEIFKLFYENDIQGSVNQKSKLSEQFKFSQGVFPPLFSTVGGFVSQEILKACGNKFSPLSQIWTYHIDLKLGSVENKNMGGRYGPIANLLGEDNLKKIQNNSIFIVGCGAIGCEHIKNFSLLGFKHLLMTDMDSIELSNLNRQFLFREEDIGKMKSDIASKRAKLINDEIKTTAFQKNIESGVFNLPNFYEKNNIALFANALDNIEARLAVDNLSLTFNIPLFDSGTLGTKGNTQVCIPHLSESYGSSRDPPEESIPLCTLRNFPNLPLHCVEFGLMEFKTLFVENISKNENVPRSVEESVFFLIDFFYEVFNKNIKKLLDTYPEDHKTDDGLPFWNLKRKRPRTAEFDFENEFCAEFIVSGVNIYNHILGNENILSLPAIKKIYENNNFTKKSGEVSFKTISFEKDSSTNFHVEFVYAVSHLRCFNYKIDSSNLTRLEVKGIAGKIVPAIATTTAMVSGLITTEIVRYLLGQDDIEQYRNMFVNLSLPLIVEGSPIVPLKNRENFDGSKITNWYVHPYANMTLENFLVDFKVQYKKEIDFISLFNKTIYCSFQSYDEKNLGLKFSEIFKNMILAGNFDSERDGLGHDEFYNQFPYILIYCMVDGMDETPFLKIKL